MTGSLLLFAAVPAWSQQNFAPAPLTVAPVIAPTPKIPAKPVREPVVADRLLPSTELGFEKGIGPAVGRIITYRDKRYEVTEVSAMGGGPTFSGNSRFAIAPEGRGLIVGLKSIDPEVFAALPASTGASLN